MKSIRHMDLIMKSETGEIELEEEKEKEEKEEHPEEIEEEIEEESIQDCDIQ